MRILWLDINSSYSHSSTAFPAIHAQVSGKSEWEWFVVRGTINDDPGTLAASVAEYNPDVIAATFWLFTHRIQTEVLSRVVQLLDNVDIVCGGPEFLGNNEAFLRQHSYVSAVIRGEGEISLPEFLNHINDRSAWHETAGLCWIGRDDSKYYDNGTAKVEDFAALRYPEESQFFNWDKPFVQLETTRGCFNTCTFCVSGGEKPVRQQSVSQVAERLENIYAHGIKDIRVLDRTFNHDSGRACSMLDLFSKYAGKMRFHLEIHPALLPESLKARLSELPEGLLHLEAGIQSLDGRVLAECGRKGSLKSSLEGLKYLCSLENIQTHADLIAGLPGYSLNKLCSDICTLVQMNVDELQLESLKVLPGTKMKTLAQEKGLKYSPLPPYEVLMTAEMSPGEIKTAMQISRMLDFYYNSKAWNSIIRELIVKGESEFITDFTDYLKKCKVLDSPLSIERRGELLYEYCSCNLPEMVSEVAVSWILAGCSLKKKPAEHVIRIKDLNTYLDDNGGKLEIRYGFPMTSHRYYILKRPDCCFAFGYDSLNHQPLPAFMAAIA